MSLYMKNPELQEALIRNQAHYSSAPAVENTSAILPMYAMRQAASRNAGEGAQRSIDRGNRRLGLARSRSDLNRRRFDLGRRKSERRIENAWDRFDEAKKYGNLSSLFGVANLGLRTAGAVAEKNRTQKILSTIGDMEKQARDADDREGMLAAKILKMHYGG